MKPTPAVVLWWDDALRVLAPDGRLLSRTLAAGADHVAEIQKLIAAECAGISALRIVYHPAHLDLHLLPCPDTSRAKLRTIFAHQHPALALPDTVWAVEPIRRHRDGDGCNTILYLDHRSPLPRLLAALQSSGIDVEGAWPLQTVIEATPACEASVDGFVSVLGIGRRSLVSCLRPNGARFLRLQEQPSPKLGPDLNAALAFFEGAPFPAGLVVGSDEAWYDFFRETVRDFPFQKLTVAEFLSHARRLKPSGFSDFTPRRPIVTRKTFFPAAVALAGIAALAWSVQSAYFGHRRAHAAHDALTRIEREQSQLALLVASRRATKEEIERLEVQIGRLRSSPQLHHRLVTSLTNALPKTMSLQTLKIEDRRFTITGKIFEGGGTAASPLIGFRRAVTTAGEPWRVEEAPIADAKDNFSLAGVMTDAR
ncbi:MAG: hypothetical protein JNK23_08365 [Opitutaceae bacterium]|nr:hypothetical protein [Opitutaceae bacterium]